LTEGGRYVPKKCARRKEKSMGLGIHSRVGREKTQTRGRDGGKSQFSTE